MMIQNLDPRISLTDLNRETLCFPSAVYTLDGTKSVSRGGSCLVYHAWKQDSHGPAKKVVLKEFYPLHTGCDQWRNREDGSVLLPSEDLRLQHRKGRFLESYKLLRRLYNEDSTNLYTVQSGTLLEGNGTYYIEEDYSSAVDLARYMDRDDLTLFDILSILRELAGIVQRIHALGYFQLDLKPENLLWVDNRLLRLMDTDTFLYKPSLEAGHWEELRLSVSRDYSPPEIRRYAESLDSPRTRKKILHYGHRGDIYSFGCILGRWLLGTKWCASDLPGLEELETALRRRERHLPGKAVRLIRELLEKTAAPLIFDRADSMAEVTALLDQLLILSEPRKVRLAEHFRGNPYPVLGLEDKLEQLGRKLEQQQDSSRIVFVSGPGGVGKSTLAREYARQTDGYDIVAEVSAGSVEQLLSRLQILNWEADRSLPRREQLLEKGKKLGELSLEFRSLIIVHDFDTPGDPDFGLLYGWNCDVILTGRYDWHFSGIPTVSLSCKDYAPENRENTAREIFLQYYLQEESSQELLQFLQADAEAVDRLTERLSFHPLSLKLMARQMAAIPGQVILPREALNRLLREGFSREDTAAYQNDTPQSIHWSHTQGHLRDIFRSGIASGRFTRQQLEALRYMLVVSPYFGISPSRFRDWTGMGPEQLEILRGRGWLEWEPYRPDPLEKAGAPGVYTMPLAIREVLREAAGLRLTTENCGGMLKRLSDTVDTYRSYNAFLSFCEQQKNLICLLDGEKTLAYARLLRCAEHGLHQMDGSKAAGETLLEYGRRRLEIYRCHPDTQLQQANCCLQLSRYAFELGDKTEALSWAEQYLLLEQQDVRIPNRDAIWARLQLNELLWSCGAWAKVLELARGLLEAAVSQLGEGDILSLNARYNLGGYLLQYGDLSQAEDLLWEVVQICQDPQRIQSTPESEQFRARSLFLLGKLYLEVDYGESAVTCLQQAYKIFSRWWGKDHLFCGEILCYLADALVMTQDLVSAVPCRADAYAVYCKQPEGQLFPAANCLFQLVADCLELPERKELGQQLWQENRKLYNQAQNFLQVETWQDVLELIRQVSWDHMEKNNISKGLELRELHVRLLKRILGPSGEVREACEAMAELLQSRNLPLRAQHYQQLARKLSP